MWVLISYSSAWAVDGFHAHVKGLAVEGLESLHFHMQHVKTCNW